MIMDTGNSGSGRNIPADWILNPFTSRGADLKKIVLKSYKNFITFFTEILKKGIESGHIRRIDPLEGAEMLFSMTLGLLMHGLLRPGSQDWVDLSKKNIRLLLAPQ